MPCVVLGMAACDLGRLLVTARLRPRLVQRVQENQLPAGSGPG